MNQSRTESFSYLGSTDAVTDAAGTVIERLSYDPHGKRRNANWTGAAGILASVSTDRGFTDHEHLDEVGLIHMNGRVYDPTLGRFLSADPTVQYPEASQSLNRYSYVLNNPLSFTDPTGYGIGSFFKSIGHAFKKAFRWISKNWRTIAAIAVTAVGWQFGLTGAFIGGFTSGLIASGGDFRVGLISGITAAAFYEVGGMNFKGLSIGKFSYGKVFAHGVVGGVSSELQGGRFGGGFLSAGFTQTVAQTGAFKHLPGNPEAWSGRASATAAAAVVGGTAGVVGGGKFANGAVTGAFSYAFGEAARRALGTQEAGVTQSTLANTTIELRHNEIFPWLGSLSPLHAYVVVTDNLTGVQTAFRAGPGMPFTNGLFGSIEAEGPFPYKVGARDYTMTPARSSVVLTSNVSANIYINLLANYTAQINYASIAYNPLFSNSNSFAYGAVQFLGVRRPATQGFTPAAQATLQ